MLEAKSVGMYSGFIKGVRIRVTNVVEYSNEDIHIFIKFKMTPSAVYLSFLRDSI